MLEKYINNILIDEKVYWKQRSRSNQLLERDRNTKNFHANGTTRKRKNKKWGVLDEKGNWAEEAEVIERRRNTNQANPRGGENWDIKNYLILQQKLNENQTQI